MANSKMLTALTIPVIAYWLSPIGYFEEEEEDKDEHCTHLLRCTVL